MQRYLCHNRTKGKPASSQAADKGGTHTNSLIFSQDIVMRSHPWRPMDLTPGSTFV